MFGPLLRSFRGALYVLQRLAAWAVLPSLAVAAAHAPAPGDFLQSIVGQKLILRHVGDQPNVKLKRKQLPAVHGTCDVAVEVKRAAWKSGQALFFLEPIGTPMMQGASGRCRTTGYDINLEIMGFAQDESPESLSASLAEILQTPEQFLAAHGVVFSLLPGPDDEPVSNVTHPPAARTLLSIAPEFSEEARRAKYQGSLVVRFVLGTDGRIHKPQVTRKLGMGLDEAALRVLPLWRFEQPRQLGKPVAVPMNVEIDFHLY
ncbi:MAG TPA: energy transducer TonB [Candidatus Angelobacter sp.]